MAIRKNKKRIDPRYFLNETTYRDLDEQDLMEDDWREKQTALIDAGVDPSDINDCLHSEHGLVKCLVMKNTGYANQLRDLGLIPAQPGS
jgi:hypothetical protein